MSVGFDLARFHMAQQGAFDTALAELHAGRKKSHWMWFIFQQMAGLGRSPMAMRYAIGSLGEARAYLADPLLADRLEAVTKAVLHHPGLSATQILGTPDDMKFHASMTLFAEASGGDDPYEKALETFFGGVPHAPTLDLLGGSKPG